MFRDQHQEYYAQKLIDSLKFSMIDMSFEWGYCKTHIIKTQSQIIQDCEALRWDRCPNPAIVSFSLFERLYQGIVGFYNTQSFQLVC